MRRCAVCGKETQARKCPDDSFPTLRVVSGSGREIGPGAVLGKRYKIIDLIGQGGFGKVFGCEDMRNGSSMAVKVLSPAFNAEGDEATRRFVREANTTSMLTHGNTIRVFDYGQTENGQLFLLMERLHGESLRKRLQRALSQGRGLPAREIISIGSGVLSSLAEAHAGGLVHRDMKPENIFLHQLGRRDIVKVLDFGIVRQKGSQMTQAGQPIGTPTHMSPEQVMGRGEVDGRSDLYSLAVCLYECAALRLPIDRGGNALMTMMAHVTQEFIPLSETAPDLPDDLSAVIEKALAKEPDERHQTGKQMRDALRQCKDAGRTRRISQVTSLAGVLGDEPSKRNKDSHRLLRERRLSRLSVGGRPRSAKPPPPPAKPPRRASQPPPPPATPPSATPPSATPPRRATKPSHSSPVRAVQSDAASVQGSAKKRDKKLHFATTQRLVEDNLKDDGQASEGESTKK